MSWRHTWLQAAPEEHDRLPCTHSAWMKWGCSPSSHGKHGRKWRKTELTGLKGQIQTADRLYTHSTGDRQRSGEARERERERETLSASAANKQQTLDATLFNSQHGSDDQQLAYKNYPRAPSANKIPPSLCLVWSSRVGCWRSRNFQLEKSPFWRLIEGRRRRV